MAIETVNPATGRLVRRFSPLSEQEITHALESARNAFPGWRETSIARRTDLIKSVAAQLRGNCGQWAQLMTLEMGKPLAQAEAEIAKCAWVCDHYAEHGENMLTPSSIATDAHRSYVRYDPLGVILGIMPWNFPFWQVFRFAVPALVAGNTVLLKHASNVPQCALAISEVFQAAGMAQGVFQTLLIGSERAEELVADPLVAAVSLTGSDTAGRRVAAVAGKTLKKSLLELGGSDPFVVLEDADLEAAATAAVASRVLNTGQSCIAAKRFVVVEKIHGQFVDALRKKLSRLRVGDPMNRDVDVGPLAREDIRTVLHGQVQETLKAGAKLLLGGRLPAGDGFFYPVTLIDGVNPEMVAAREETFGPVAILLKAKNADEALELANRTDFGLGASIWTSDLDRALSLASRVDAGTVFFNSMVKSDPRLPFGGIKLSGFGRELGVEGIREFVNVKSVWIDLP